MPKKDAYNMKLHETRHMVIAGKEITIIRVPGGWLYIYQYMDGQTMVYVPFHDEFMVGAHG
jgi:hypothetical protein